MQLKEMQLMSEKNRQVFLKRGHRIFKIIEYNRKNDPALHIQDRVVFSSVLFYI